MSSNIHLIVILFLLFIFRPSNAGEEEFYFDDVNIDSNTTSGYFDDVSNTTSGISSSEESLHDEIPKTKYRRSITTESTDTIQNKTVLKFSGNNNSNISSSLSECHTISSSTSEPPEFKKDCIKPTVKLKTVTTAPKNSSKHEYKIPTFFSLHTTSDVNRSAEYNSSSAPSLPFNPINYLSPKKETHDPMFNINFVTNDQSSSTRIFMPTETTTQPLPPPRGRGKGRKKCRKVYGMNNKQLWCTQCRWKKACVRFT